MFKATILFFGFILVMLSNGNSQKLHILPSAENISALKFLGEYDISFNLKYKNTTVGGLSGIDYDAKNNLYYMICDDRSEKNPARFYTVKIFITSKGIDSIRFT